MTRLTIAAIAAVAAVVAVGALFLVLDDRAAPPIVISDPRPDATIVVGVGGAVASPGVYALSGDARAQDALAAAGGANRDADLAALNLARRLRDEDQLVVPRLVPTAAAASDPSSAAFEPVPPPGPNETPPAAPAAVPAAAAGPVDLNTATVADLDRLPGIGPVLAQRIVDHRTVVGPFRAVDDLADVQGISSRMVEDLRSMVRAGA